MSRHSQLMLARNFGSAKRRAPANLRSKPATLSRAIWFCAFAAACDRPACVIGALPVQCLEAGGPIREVILRQRVGHQSVAGPCIASRSALTNADRLIVALVLVPSGPVAMFIHDGRDRVARIGEPSIAPGSKVCLRDVLKPRTAARERRALPLSAGEWSSPRAHLLQKENCGR